MMTVATTARRTPDTLMQRYARAARAAGVPRDQLENFIRGGYVAQRHQLAFHAAARRADDPDGPDMIAFGGRRGPGKTHATFAQVALDDCQRVGDLKFLFLRKVLKAARESFEDVRRKVLYTTPHAYRQQAGVVEFENTSRIVLGHFSKESDIDNYLGIEYDGIAVEELTQLSKSKIDMLRGSMRSTKPHWRPRLYATTNPGGIGHAYFRSTFVQPYRHGAQTNTLFIPANADENRYLDAGYRKWLQSLSGALGRMWRDGDWDVAGGAFFTNWNYQQVVIAPLAEIPPHWRLHLAMDYGYRHWNVIYVIAESDDGVLYFVGEIAMRQALVPQVAARLSSTLADLGIARDRIDVFVAGHDCWGTESSGRTVADQWQDADWVLTRANVDRKQGAAEWLRRLGNEAAGIPCSVKMTTACPRLIDSLPMMLSNPNEPEDVLKVNADDDGEGGDDFYDAGRYGIMARRSVAAALIPGPNPLADWRG